MHCKSHIDCVSSQISWLILAVRDQHQRKLLLMWLECHFPQVLDRN